MVKMKLARGLAWNYASYAVEAIVGLGVVAFVVRRVGVADYGVLTLALAITSLLTVLDLGLLGLLVQAYVGERTAGGSEAVGKLASAAMSRLVVAGLIGFLICALIGLAYPGPFSIDAALTATAKRCLLLVGASLIVSLPSLAIELAFVTCSFGVMSRERRRQPGISVGIDFSPTLLRPKHCISKRLRRFVCELPRAKCFEADFAFIERALRGLACAVEFFLELVE